MHLWMMRTADLTLLLGANGANQAQSTAESNTTLTAPQVAKLAAAKLQTVLADPRRDKDRAIFRRT